MVVTPESNVTFFYILTWLPLFLTSRNPFREKILQPSRPDSHLNLAYNYLPLCALSLLMLHNRNLRVMLNSGRQFRLKRGKVTHYFAVRSILKEHLYCFLQIPLCLNDGFPLACNS